MNLALFFPALGEETNSNKSHPEIEIIAEAIDDELEALQNGEGDAAKYLEQLHRKYTPDSDGYRNCVDYLSSHWSRFLRRVRKEGVSLSIWPYLLEKMNWYNYGYRNGTIWSRISPMEEVYTYYTAAFAFANLRNNEALSLEDRARLQDLLLSAYIVATAGKLYGCLGDKLWADERIEAYIKRIPDKMASGEELPQTLLELSESVFASDRFPKASPKTARRPRDEEPDSDVQNPLSQIVQNSCSLFLDVCFLCAASKIAGLQSRWQSNGEPLAQQRALFLWMILGGLSYRQSDKFRRQRELISFLRQPQLVEWWKTQNKNFVRDWLQTCMDRAIPSSLLHDFLIKEISRIVRNEIAKLEEDELRELGVEWAAACEQQQAIAEIMVTFRKDLRQWLKKKYTNFSGWKCVCKLSDYTARLVARRRLPQAGAWPGRRPGRSLTWSRLAHRVNRLLHCVCETITLSSKGNDLSHTERAEKCRKLLLGLNWHLCHEKLQYRMERDADNQITEDTFKLQYWRSVWECLAGRIEVSHPLASTAEGRQSNKQSSVC